MIRIREAINYLVAFLTIISLNFFLPRLMAGDPLTAIYGSEALVQMTPELKAQLVERFALNQPLWRQFVGYLGALCRGDLGYSYYFNAPVAQIIAGVLPWTLLLVGTAIFISTVIGAVLGIETGWRRGKRADKLILTGMLFWNGFPDFFLGMVLLIVFGVVLNVFPLAGGLTPYAGYTGFPLALDILKHLVLPVCSLVLVNLSGCYLLSRNTMVNTLGENYILTARAKGLSEAAVKYRHAGRNTLLPVITHSGLQMGRLLTGAFFIETVFAYPGLGLLVQKAFQTRDYPVIQGGFFVIAVFILAANFLTDLAYKIIDPRLRKCISATGKKLNPIT